MGNNSSTAQPPVSSPVSEPATTNVTPPVPPPSAVAPASPPNEIKPIKPVEEPSNNPGTYEELHKACKGNYLIHFHWNTVKNRGGVPGPKCQLNRGLNLGPLAQLVDNQPGCKIFDVIFSQFNVLNISTITPNVRFVVKQIL